MTVSLKVAFSLLDDDGRLSTKMEDVYMMLDYIFDQETYTHMIPDSCRELERINPVWFKKAKQTLRDIKRHEGTNDFNALMRAIDAKYSDVRIKLGKVDAKVSFFSRLMKR